jgi:PKD repeat protein
MHPRTTTRRTTAGQARARLFALVTAAAAATACTDASRATVTPAPATIDQARSRTDSLSAGFFATHEVRAGLVPRTASKSAGPSAATASVVSVTPGWFQGASQRQPITAVLSGAVNSVTVSGMGAILCSGTFGTLVAYDANGAVLASSALTLTAPWDCGYDDLTFGAQATVTVTQGVIASFKILPMSPFEFQVNGVSGGRASATYYVTLGEYPTVDNPPTAMFFAGCSYASLTCTFDASNSKDDVGIVSYVWDLDNAPNSVATGVKVTATYPQAGPRTIKLTVTDTKGQTSSYVLTLTIGIPPGTPPIALFQYSCSSLSCFFDSQTSTGSSALVKSWDFGDGTTAGNFVQTSHGYSAPGWYAAVLTVTDNLGLSDSRAEALKLGLPQGGPNVGMSVDCFVGPGACSFDAVLSGANPPFTISWRFGDGTTGGNIASLTHTYPAAGTYVVLLIATDAQGLQGAAAIAVKVTAPPPIDATPIARFTVNCTGQTYPHQCAFDASTSSDDKGIVSYKWDWGNGRSETKSGPSVRNTWASGGSFNVTLTVKDAKGQTNTLTKLVTVP